MSETAVETGRLMGIRPAGIALAVIVTTAVAGCRTGSWTPSSSWSMFGSQPKSADTVAAGAPAGDITKPSATAQPYPTTSTPESYSLARNTPVPGTTPPADVGPVVYGSTPPPAGPTAVAGAAVRGSDPGPPATPLAAIAPQVGPYASSGGGTPNGWDDPPPVATPESTPYPGVTPGSASPPPARLAENTPATSWSPAAESAVPSVGPSSRYATGNSRFSSPSATPVGAAEVPTGFQPLLAAPPSASPFPPPPAAAFDQAPPPATPTAIPPMVPPAAAPRRPDPGYRPGGTSSYRSRPDVIMGERAVQPVVFDGIRPAVP